MNNCVDNCYVGKEVSTSFWSQRGQWGRWWWRRGKVNSEKIVQKEDKEEKTCWRGRRRRWRGCTIGSSRWIR